MSVIAGSNMVVGVAIGHNGNNCACFWTCHSMVSFRISGRLLFQFSLHSTLYASVPVPAKHGNCIRNKKSYEFKQFPEAGVLPSCLLLQYR